MKKQDVELRTRITKGISIMTHICTAWAVPIVMLPMFFHGGHTAEQVLTLCRASGLTMIGIWIGCCVFTVVGAINGEGEACEED